MTTLEDDRPRDRHESDTARRLRVLAAIALLITVTALPVLSVILPAVDADTASAAESSPVAAPVLIGA